MTCDYIIMISLYGQVIHCISQLELAQFIGSGVKSRYLATIQSTSNAPSAQQPANNSGGRGSINAMMITGERASYRVISTDSKIHTTLVVVLFCIKNYLLQVLVIWDSNSIKSL